MSQALKIKQEEANTWNDQIIWLLYAKYFYNIFEIL